jgi:membrane protein
MKSLLALLKQTGAAWENHNAQRMGAALSYYSVLSMAPLVIITIAIASFAFTRNQAQGEAVAQVRSIMGDAGAEVILGVLQQSGSEPSSGIVASAIGVLTLLLSASGVFTELRSSLNTIWDVPKDQQASGLAGTVKIYVFSVAMVLTIGFLLLISLLLTTFLELFEHWLTSHMPAPAIVAQVFNQVLSFALISLVFALIYKFVPNVKITWTDVAHGAIATALLFTLGKYALAVYIGKMSVGSAYGAAGSLVALLVWVYYSAQIFFFGAEFTHIYALQRGARREAR